MVATVPRLLTPVLRGRLKDARAVALLGPRQCGKSTLALEILAGLRPSVYLDLERPSDLSRLRDPEAYFGAHARELVCLDEIQQAPELFGVLRGVIDRARRNGQFLILGSASPELLQKSSETLAGRVSFLELTPFLLPEVAESESDRSGALNRHWLRGGFPLSFLAADDPASFAWRESFITTFLERDMARLAQGVATSTWRRFWQMCAHLHGQLWNGSKVAGALGVAHTTVRRYLDAMVGAYVLRALPPLAANLGKRLVRSPKVYVRDSGLVHALLAIETDDHLLGHPVRGSSWEGYVIEQVLGALPRWEASFFRTAAGAECDLVLQRGRSRYCIECKASSAPEVTRGFWNALDDLKPKRAWVVAPVRERYALARGVQVVPLSGLLADLAALE